MTSTVYTNYAQPAITAEWLNDVNANVYGPTAPAGTLRSDIVSTTGSSLIGYSSTGTGAQGRTVQDKLRESLSVFDFMTAAQIADVQNRALTLDVSTALNTALLEAKTSGKSLLCPAGSYKVSNINIEDAALVGTGVQANDSPVNDGTVFCIYDTVNPAFNVARGARFAGISIYYPTQVLSGTPTVFPVTFKGITTDTLTQANWDNIIVINAYAVFSFGDAAYTNGHGRLSITNSTILGIANVFDMHNVLDVIQVNNCVFSWGQWDLVSNNTQTVKNWIAKNGVFATCDRVDGFTVSNSIIYGMSVGVWAVKDTVDLSTFSNVLFDAVAVPLKVAAAAMYSNTTYSSCSFNCYTYGDAAAAPDAFDIASTNAGPTKITFAACQFAVARGNFFAIQGTAVSVLSVSASHFHAIGTATGASGERSHIYVNNTNAVLTLSSCNLDGNGYATANSLHLNSIRDFAITGNRWRLNNAAIIVSSMSGLGVITGNVSSGTTGAASIVLQGATVNGATRLGLNNWDKMDQDNVGSPKFCRQVGSTVSITTTETSVPFSTAIFDTTASYNNAANTYVAPMTGIYRFSLRLTHDSAAASSQWTIKFKTGTGYFSYLYTPPGTGSNTFVASCLASLPASGTVMVTVQRIAGAGTFTTLLDGQASSFEGELIQ